MPVPKRKRGSDPSAHNAINSTVANKLREFGDLLHEQGSNGFRTRAYWRAADMVARLDRPLDTLYKAEGLAGLVALPAIGTSIAAAIAELLRTGHWAQLERLRGGVTPATLFLSLPGIGTKLARRLSEETDIESLEELESALHLGELSLKGFGPRRKRMLSAVLAERLGRSPLRMLAPAEAPPIDMLLKVDRMYRERAAKGQLRLITPRRFNPGGIAWLPIMHASHDDWHFTALFSNTALAHKLGKTKDWVMIFHQRDGFREGQSTVVTETHGGSAGQRVVRGREDEIAADPKASRRASEPPTGRQPITH